METQCFPSTEAGQGTKASCSDSEVVCGDVAMKWAPRFVKGVIEEVYKVYSEQFVSWKCNWDRMEHSTIVDIDISVDDPTAGNRIHTLVKGLKKRYPRWFGSVGANLDCVRPYMKTEVVEHDQQPKRKLVITIPNHTLCDMIQKKRPKDYFKMPVFPVRYAEYIQRCQGTIADWGKQFVTDVIAITKRSLEHVAENYITQDLHGHRYLQRIIIQILSIPTTQQLKQWLKRLNSKYPGWFYGEARQPQ